jgi:hypothetical protein
MCGSVSMFPDNVPLANLWQAQGMLCSKREEVIDKNKNMNTHDKLSVINESNPIPIKGEEGPC